MAILDGRTLLDDAEADTNWVDTGGGSGLGLDNEIFAENANSIPYTLGNSVEGVLYNAGAEQDWSNSHFYIWFNTTLAGKLQTKALGGVRIRFCGGVIDDWFEVFVDGKDTYSGGWKMLVVDIEKAKIASDAVGGTPPATNLIQYVGVTGDTAGFMPRNIDNFWVDAIWRLPSATAGIKVEGTNSGPDWTFDDIVAASAAGDWGTCVKKDGIITINTPITFGANDAVTHGFSDTNQVIAWEDKLVADDFYGFDVIGGSGIQSFELGIKSGIGDDATGAQGIVVTADAAAVRWYFNGDDANVDVCNIYGCQFQHASNFALNDAQVSVISTLFLDCTSALVSNAGDFLRCSIVAANTADGVAFITTDDLSDIKYCEFAFSDGHAIELTTPNTSSQTSLENTYTGYLGDGTTDAAVYNNSGSGLVTISVSGGDSPTIRNGTSATTNVESSVTVNIEGVTEGSAISVIANETVGTLTIGDVIMQGLADSTGAYQITTFNYEGAFGAGVDVIARVRQQGLPNAAIAYDADGTPYDDETTAANSSILDDMNLIPATTPAVNDAYYFGHNEQFSRMKLDISQIFIGTTLTLTWQYYNGSWVSLSGISDGCSVINGFDQVGENIISWTVPGDWVDVTVNSQGPFKMVRALISTVTSMTQQPLGRKVKLDITRYLPFNADRIITSVGLNVVASWTEDKIAQF